MRIALCAVLVLAISATGCVTNATPRTTSCLDASPAMVNTLVSSLTVAGGGTLTKVRVLPVKVSDVDKAQWHLVAGLIQGKGISRIGVWVTTANLSTTGGVTYSTDYLTKEFSQWPLPNDVKNRFPSNDPDVKHIRQCVSE